MVDQAIILAAGLGQRLRPRSASKPLTPVHGASLIEIGVRQLIAAGIEKITVVTGYEADRLEEEVRSVGRVTGADVSTARLDDWSKPNGWSVIAGAKGIEGPFLLTMADHLFADGLLAALAKHSLADCDVVLATDRVDNPLVDPDDATWVALDDERRITKIGKHISRFDAVDCGAFLAGPQLPRAIETAIAKGKPGSLSDGMQVLANNRRAGVMDVDGKWWLDVDDPRALDLALAQAPDHIAFLAERTETAQADGAYAA